MNVRRRFSRAGVAGTIVLALVVLACVRLGFWQLDRRDQRIAINERMRQRLEAPPITSGDALTDTATAHYRSARLIGRYDVPRTIVLPGRSLKGVPGVHLVTPLRLASGSAVLVNRGWVPSPDAATVELDSFPVTDSTAQGIVLPFPGREQSLAPVERVRADSFRTVWYALDPAALRAQFPYPLAPVLLQLLPAGDAPRYPRRLDAPPMDEGPHLSYAFQWFAFAIIGVVGWIALFLSGRRTRRVTLVPLLLFLVPGALNAQLRPLDPLDWRIFEPQVQLIGSIGGARLFDQPATVAAAYGDLLEIGTYRLLWRSGRVALDLSGTAFWRFHEDSVGGTPLPDVEPPRNGVRADAGPALASTVVRLTAAESRHLVVLRFGTRIPTTSDESGLERDRTDFFALAGGRLQFGHWSFSGESGVGINGAQREDYPQSDVWIYTVGAAHQRGRVAAFGHLVGHQDGHTWQVQGNEDQAELRAGLRYGERWWFQAQYAHGIRGAAPAHGIMIAAGFALGCRTDCLPYQ